MELEHYVKTLRRKLAGVSSRWTVKDYNSLVMFYINSLPKLMGVERCTIFLKEAGGDSLVSMYGTALGEQGLTAPIKGSVVGLVMREGVSVIDNELYGREGYHQEADQVTGFSSRNTLCVPVRGGSEIIGVIQLLNKDGNGSFDDNDLQELEEIAGYLSISIEPLHLNRELARIGDEFEKDVAQLELSAVRDGSFIAESDEMRAVLAMVAAIRDTPVNILIQGENGTGKEMVARMIYEQTGKKGAPFVPVNCACLPESLVESEFFGHEKGAFTGADKSRKGRFEEAEGGVLFLDEIGEMPLTIQPKFLRAIQEQEGCRLGSSTIIPYNVRLISATNRNLSDEVAKGNFREDLFFRLFSVEIEIPPLRERRDDIMPLARFFLEKVNRKFDKTVVGFSMGLLGLLEEYPWPGNVRQLHKEVERLVALTANGEIMQVDTCSRELREFADEHHIDEVQEDDSGFSMPAQVASLEKKLIYKAMKEVGNNKTRAAGLLDITRQGLLKKIKRYGLEFS